MDDSPYRLYRYFDTQDVLLYVGITGDIGRRDGSHITRSKWMQFTAHSSAERRDSLADLKAAEHKAIEAEQPIFNKLHNSTPEAVLRLRAYLEAAGRLDLMPLPHKSRRPQFGLGGATFGYPLRPNGGGRDYPKRLHGGGGGTF
jgi:predicted GIY-YIG superfamily endonuclease